VKINQRGLLTIPGKLITSHHFFRQFLSTVSSFERTSNVKAEQKPSFAVSDVNQITEAPSRNDTADYNKIPIRELGKADNNKVSFLVKLLVVATGTIR